jgi:hypothetical protein
MLTKDPIIIQMAEDIRQGFDQGLLTDGDLKDLMIPAHATYLDRGGKDAVLVGDPIRAIKTILGR